MSAAGRARWAVVFEVRPEPARMDEYLGIAAGLRPALESVAGFLENERFRSLDRPGVLLSLSLWESEAGIVRWRTMERHRLAQQAGRDGIFLDYRLRVGPCTTAMPAAGDGQARFLALFTGATAGASTRPEARLPQPVPMTHERFEHLAEPERQLALAAWPDARSAARHMAGHGAGSAIDGGLFVRVERDYGMRDRAQAPQHYPPR